MPADAEGNYKTYASLGESYDDVLKTMRGLIPSHIVVSTARSAHSPATMR